MRGDGARGKLSADSVQLFPYRKVLCKKLGHRKKKEGKKDENVPTTRSFSGPVRWCLIWSLTPFGTSLVGCALASSVAGLHPSRPRLVPSSYAIIFGPRPVST